MTTRPADCLAADAEHVTRPLSGSRTSIMPGMGRIKDRQPTGALRS